MKNSLSLLVMVLTIASCTKDPHSFPPDKLKARFSMGSHCMPYSSNDSAQYLDTTVLFINQSDTSKNVTWQWDFGDNTSSTATNPSHTYNRPGIYPVTLYTFNMGQPSDTLTRTLRIMVGQKEFKTPLNNAHCIDVEEGPEKGVVFVADDYDYNYYPANVIITGTDSLLRPVWTKSLGPGTRISSIKKAGSTGYLLSGNYMQGKTDSFCISKINASGDLSWQKYLAVTGTNNYTLLTSSGELLTVGTTAGNLGCTAIVKCDASGNELWRKSFDGTGNTQRTRYPFNIIETVSGFLIASLNLNGDQIVLTKLDAAGNIVSQSNTATGYIGTIFSAGVAATANNVLVFTTNTQYVFNYTSSLAFVDSRKVTETAINCGIAANDHFYIGEGNHQYAYVRELNATGQLGWSVGISSSVGTACGSQTSGLTRYCKRIVYTGSGDIIAFSEGDNDPNSARGWSVYLTRYGSDGKMK